MRFVFKTKVYLIPHRYAMRDGSTYKYYCTMFMIKVSLAPQCFAMRDGSTYKFQFATLLKLESHSSYNIHCSNGRFSSCSESGAISLINREGARVKTPEERE